MSSLWFSTSNRPVATSFLNVTSAVLNIFSMYLPTLAINTDSVPSSEIERYKQRLANLHLTYAGTASLIGAMCLLLYRENPTSPVSRASKAERLSIRESLSHFRRNKALIFPILAGALTGGVVVAYEVIIEAGFRQYGSSTLSIRDYTLLSTPFLMAVSLLLSCISGCSGSFLVFIIAGNLLNLASVALLLALYTDADPLFFGLTFIITAVTLAS